MRHLVALAALVTLLAVTTTAGATTSLAPSWRAVVKLTLHLPKDATVKFRDYGGRCDAEKTYPSGLVEHMNGELFTLFKSKRDGNCFVERSDAQYKVVVTLKDGRSYWTYVNVVQEYVALPKFLTHCYGNGTLPCEGGHNSPSLSVSGSSVNGTGEDIPLRLGPIPGVG